MKKFFKFFLTFLMFFIIILAQLYIGQTFNKEEIFVYTILIAIIIGALVYELK
jgi:hypothetical protein